MILQSFLILTFLTFTTSNHLRSSSTASLPPHCPDNCSGHGSCTRPVVRTAADAITSTGNGGVTQSQIQSNPTLAQNQREPHAFQCNCYNEWTGSNCNTKAGDLDDCVDRCSNGQGECLTNTKTGPNEETFVCHCFHPYTGPTCAASMCPKHCNGRGKCLQDGCKCSSGWTGSGCTEPLCNRFNDCNGKRSKNGSRSMMVLDFFFGGVFILIFFCVLSVF